MTEPAALIERLMERLSQDLDQAGPALVRRAIELAEAAHRGQVRDDGTPYLAHPLRTALALTEEFGITDARTIGTALLHDAAEDNDAVSVETVREEVGLKVAEAVKTLSKPPRNGRPYSEVNQEYFPRMRSASEEVRLVKLVDRLDNVRDLPNCANAGKRGRMLEETRSFYLPLISTLGNSGLQALLKAAFTEAIQRAEEVHESSGTSTHAKSDGL